MIKLLTLEKRFLGDNPNSFSFFLFLAFIFTIFVVGAYFQKKKKKGTSGHHDRTVVSPTVGP